MKKTSVFALSLFCLLILISSCGAKSRIPYSQRQSIIKTSIKLIDQKASWREVLPLYKKLTTFEKANSDARQKTLRYLLDDNLRLVNERKGEEALEFALELDKLIPNDFYIQNRILGAYRVMAEDAIKKKDWNTAYDLLYKKALSIRFDTEVMRTYLKLRKLMAKEEIAQKHYDVARTYLAEIISIANIEENKSLYGEEFTEAEKLLKKLSQSA